MVSVKDVKQYLQSARVSVRGDIQSTQRGLDADVGAGNHSRYLALRDGLALQSIKAEYREDIEFKHVMKAGFGIYLHFEDTDGLDLSFEGYPLPVGRHRQTEERPFGFAVCREQPVMFHRRGAKGTRLCVVIVWLSPLWFDQTFGLRNWAIPPGSRQHLAISRWFPSRRIASLALSLFDPDTQSSMAARLQYEIVALELVTEALGTMRPPGVGGARRTDTLLLNKVSDIIETDLAGDLSILKLASELGIGARTLRRLFQEAYGCGVTDYVRIRRLDVARDMLEEGKTILEAASFAGYTKKTNFSTAFKRRFGMTPGHARDGEQ